MKLKKLLFAALLVSGTAANAGGYLGFEGGAGYVDTDADNTAQSFANATGRTVTYTYQRAALVGRIFGTFEITPEFSVEVGAFSTGTVKNTYSFSGTTVKAEEHAKATGFDTSLIANLGNTGFFGKFGFHNSKVDSGASVSINGTTYASASRDRTGTGYLAGIGYQAKLTSNSVLRYSFTHYNNLGNVDKADMNLVSVAYAVSY